jgi:nucleotide-binding universal stress UspA family protein
MIKLFDRVLIAVGDAEQDSELLRYSRVVADLSKDVERYFVHVLGWSNQATFKQEPATHAQTQRTLEENVALNGGTDNRTRCLVLHGNVVDRLLESAAELGADLILVGHSGPGGRRSLARRLAMQAPCSVWMRPRGSTLRVRRILAAIDYSEPSAYALSIASHLARRSGSSECLALHVYLNDGSAGLEEYRASDRAHEREAFERFTAPLDTAAIHVQPLLEEAASVAHAVDRVAQSKGADLVVMGSRGQSRSTSILLGSESEHVLMESRIPVLIAKRRGERIGLLQALLDRNFHLQDPPRFG